MYSRDSIFGISIKHVIWDILHCCTRIGNKFIRNTYQDIQGPKGDCITEIIKSVHQQFCADIPAGKKNVRKVMTLQGEISSHKTPAA